MNFLKSLPNSTNNEYNILLLGETGAGKSTTVNAIANYMRYTTFDEAIKNDFLELVPSNFTITNPKNNKQVTIKSGSDTNELGGGSSGKSSTKAPKTHKFNYLNNLIRLIDTPGIGDTAGIDQDKENVHQILECLHYFKELHGIVILLKSTETRQNDFFKYCITELFSHLHKSACENIVFCFTFSRSSFFTPGDGYGILKEFLENDLTSVKLKLEPNRNCFFIDNESYRFLVAKKSGIKFPDEQTSLYKESWEKSVEQTDRMFRYIIDKKPHSLENTISLNNARKLIFQIAEPIVRLQENITRNIAHIKEQEEELKNNDQDQIQLVKILFIQIDDLEQVQMPYPSTVCTAARCIEMISYQNEQKINYIKRCHEHCFLKSVRENSVGHPELQNCSSMDGGLCKECGCSWQAHMHQSSVFNKVKRNIVDLNSQKQVQSKREAIARINDTIKKLQKYVKECEEEVKVIEDVASKFAYILIENSNTPYNKFLEPYLDLMISEEQKKISSVAGYGRKNLESLEKMKATHIQNVRLLTNAIQNKSRSPIELKEIYKYIDQLSKLKHSGGQFSQMLQTTKILTKKSVKSYLLHEKPAIVMHKVDKKNKNKKK